MDESAAAGPRSASTSWRLAMFGLAVATWLASFAALARIGSWAPFALAGAALAALSLSSDVAARALLRPSLPKAGVGLAAGLLMAALTHAAFAFVTPLLPEARTATVRLFGLLNVGGFSPAARAGLVIVIAACEEVIFRGALAGLPGGREDQRLHRVRRGDLAPIIPLAAGYALATATLGSLLLMVCAFGCGVVWGALRVATRSLVAPIVAHVVWDLAVLVVWPLVGSTGR